MVEGVVDVSIIFATKNEGDFVRKTVESILTSKTGYQFEIVVVDDGSTDGSCNFISEIDKKNKIQVIQGGGLGVAKARNLGASYAKGKYFIFCDGHVLFEDFWIDKLLEPILSGEADAVNPGIASINKTHRVGYGATLKDNLRIKWQGKQDKPFPSAILIGICVAISKEVFEKVGGYDHEFKVWGRADVELSLRLWLFGYKCYVNPNVKVLHLFRSKRPYNVKMSDVYFNMLRMAYSHFNEERIAKCKALMRYSNPDLIEKDVLDSKVLEQRKRYEELRKYDDDWYMEKFKIPF